MRECRQEETTDVPDTKNNNGYLDCAPEPILRDESSTSEPDTHNVRFLRDARIFDGGTHSCDRFLSLTSITSIRIFQPLRSVWLAFAHCGPSDGMELLFHSQGNNLLHAPQSPRCNYPRPEGRHIADTLYSPHAHIPHPVPTTSPSEDGTIPRPYHIPDHANSWDHVRCQESASDYQGETLRPFPEPEAPPSTLLHHSPTIYEDMATQQTHNPMYLTSDTRKNLAVMGSRSSSSRLRINRGAAAPPLVSLPLFETDAVARHGDGIRLENNGHNEQGHMLHWDCDESAHVDFWAMGGWTPEDGYPGWRLEWPSIPTQLKGKRKAVIQDLNEDGATPEEQDFTGYGPPQPTSQANLFVHSFTTYTQTDTSYQINHPDLYKNREREDGIATGWGICRSYELHRDGASSSGFCPDFCK